MLEAPIQPELMTAGETTNTPQTPFAYTYLCSVGHSGSTLIACLLGAHPEIATVGEFGAPFDANVLHCSCGVHLAECPFWMEWQRRARARGIDFEIGSLGIDLGTTEHDPLSRVFFHQFPSHTLNRGLAGLFRTFTGMQRQAMQQIDKSIRLARLVCEMEKRRVFFDSTKNPIQPRFLAQRPDIGFRLISLVRDGRGVMNSMMKHYRFSAEVAARMWASRMRQQLEALRWVRAADILHVRVEDLWRNPDAEYARMLRFCGVDERVKIGELSFEAKDRHVVGNLMRLGFDGVIKPDYRWKSDLGTNELALFERVAGKLNRSLGAEE